MSTVWLHISDLPLSTTSDDVRTMTQGFATTILVGYGPDELTRTARALILNIKAAKMILAERNYISLQSNVVKMSLGPGDLFTCSQVILNGINGPSTIYVELQIFTYFRVFGTICGLAISNDSATIWYDSVDEARAAAKAVQKVDLSWLKDTANVRVEERSRESVIVLDSDSDSDSDSNGDIRTNSSMLSVDDLPLVTRFPLTFILPSATSNALNTDDITLYSSRTEKLQITNGESAEEASEQPPPAHEDALQSSGLNSWNSPSSSSAILLSSSSFIKTSKPASPQLQSSPASESGLIQQPVPISYWQSQPPVLQMDRIGNLQRFNQQLKIDQGEPDLSPGSLYYALDTYIMSKEATLENPSITPVTGLAESLSHMSYRSPAILSQQSSPIIQTPVSTSVLDLPTGSKHDFKSLSVCRNDLSLKRPSIIASVSPDSRPRKIAIAHKSTGGRRPPIPAKLFNGVPIDEITTIRGSRTHIHTEKQIISNVIDRKPKVAKDNYTTKPVIQDRAQSMYQLYHSQLPVYDKNNSSYCLSIAWWYDSGRGKTDFYLSQGNKQSVEDVDSWKEKGVLSVGSKSTIYSPSLDIPWSSTSSRVHTPVQSMECDEIHERYIAKDGDNNNGPVHSLKLYDHGRVLFGCTTHNITVLHTDSLRQKETLMLIDDVDGIYDVGIDYVVANSQRGEMGVWKAGSRNYIWRYYDTRKDTQAGLFNSEEPQITALKIAASDNYAYIGDMFGNLSMSDFREPYIRRLSSIHCGVVHSIELGGKNSILVGTDDGFVKQMDTRYLRNDNRLQLVKTFELPARTTVKRVRVCPHDSRLFACSSENSVYIFQRNGDNLAAPLFSHLGHRSTVCDFDWHPDPEYKYAIGSAETGLGYSSGEVQVWRPSDEILNVLK